MEKNHILNHSPNLFDAPATEAFALWKKRCYFCNFNV